MGVVPSDNAVILAALLDHTLRGFHSLKACLGGAFHKGARSLCPERNDVLADSHQLVILLGTDDGPDQIADHLYEVPVISLPPHDVPVQFLQRGGSKDNGAVFVGTRVGFHQLFVFKIKIVEQGIYGRLKALGFSDYFHMVNSFIKGSRSAVFAAFDYHLTQAIPRFIAWVRP